MSVLMSTVQRLQDDAAFGPVVTSAASGAVASAQELAEREAAANMAAVQATADALRAGDAAPTAPSDPQPAADLPPLPRIGSLVTFYPRPGEVMRGRKEAAAIVVHRDVAKRTLDLVVIYDANDFRDQERVKERTVEGERGWVQHHDQAASALVDQGVMASISGTQAILTERGEQVSAMLAQMTTLLGEFAAIKTALFGEFEAPEQSVLEMLDALDERLGKLESAKPKVKRGRRKATKAKAAKPAQESAPPSQS